MLVTEGQIVKVTGGDKGSIYYGHRAVFEGDTRMWLGKEQLFFRFLEPKPIHWSDDKPVDGDILFAREITIVE
jgi:hypothetical protein